MYFLNKFEVIIHLNIIKLSLKLLFQSIIPEKKSTNVPKPLDNCEILILGVLLKKPHKITLYIVKSL